MEAQSRSSVDAEEVAKFDRLAGDWWSPNGSMKPLHRINPARIGYLRQQVAIHFARSMGGTDGLSGLDIIDVGCGAGLMCEPLARLGAKVTGLDAAETTIEVARHHAERSGLAIDYRAVTAEDLAASGATYDVVLCLEVIEHVVDPAAFLKTCASLMKPGGLIVVSTINRTLRSYALAIVAAEQILRWLPRGTHEWSKFVRPDEIEAALEPLGLVRQDCSGLVYNPLNDSWRMSGDTAVNYFMTFAFPPQLPPGETE